MTRGCVTAVYLATSPIAPLSLMMNYDFFSSDFHPFPVSFPETVVRYRDRVAPFHAAISTAPADSTLYGVALDIRLTTTSGADSRPLIVGGPVSQSVSRKLVHARRRCLCERRKVAVVFLASTIVIDASARRLDVLSPATHPPRDALVRDRETTRRLGP